MRPWLRIQIFFRISFSTKSEIPISSAKFGDFISKKQLRTKLNVTLFVSNFKLNKSKYRLRTEMK